MADDSADDRNYYPPDSINPFAVALALIGGLIASVIGSALIVLWALSPLPHGDHLLVIAHAFAMCIAFVWLFHKFKIHNKKARFEITLGCALASLVAFHLAFYLASVMQVQHDALAELADLPQDPLRELEQQFVRDHPFTVYDNVVLLPAHHAKGFLGFVVLDVKSIGIFAFFHAAALLLIPLYATRDFVNRLFCQNCNAWFNRARHIAVLPATSVADMVAAVNSDDPNGVQTLRGATDSLDAGTATAILHRCPTCGVEYVEVELAIPDGQRIVRKTILTPFRVSSEFSQALRDVDTDVAEPPVDAEGMDADNAT